MDSSEKHIIKKAIVEIYVPSAQDAPDLQNKAFAFFKEKICPIIERIVARHSTPGETIRIDKLELDVKGFRPEEYTVSKLQDLEEQIEKKIVALISEKKANDFSGDIVTEVKRIPKEKADEELFIHLLRTGTLPWWAKTESAVSLETVAERVLQYPADSLKKELARIIAMSAVRKRIAYNLPVSLIEKIILLLCSVPDKVLEYIGDLLRMEEEAAVSSPEHLRQFMYEFVLKYPASAGSARGLFFAGLIKERNGLSFAEKLYHMSDKIMLGKTVVQSNAVIETAMVIKKALADSDRYFSGKIRTFFHEKDRKEFFMGEPEELSVDNGEEIMDDRKELNADDSLKNGLLKERKNPEEIFPGEDSREIIELTETGDHFIKNAGVIILAPYLSALFKALELCDGKAFISDEARERAAFLMQYLVTGNEAAEEHEMLLNKVLCGIDIQAPLTLQFKITAQEKEECSGLLQAVATNWTALKGTSGEGMRDAFFMRDGILEQQSNGWNLKIERTSIDVLIDRLPWTISILQMPWSKEMIFVTW